MDIKTGNGNKRLHRVIACILCVGFLCAVAVYVTADAPAETPLLDQVENSKMYRRSLELYGGKAGGLAEQFSRWFESLWHGERLAFTIAVITLLVAAIYYFLAVPLSSEER